MRPLLDKYDVIISGMGGAGLATAFEAANAGKTVLIVTNRDDDFKRLPRIILDPENRDYLQALMHDDDGSHLTKEKDIKFLNELESDPTVALKDIEAFIYRRLKKFESVNFVLHAEIKNLRLDSGEVTIGNSDPNNDRTLNRVINFQYLIGADGVNHHALNCFNKNHPHAIIQHHPILFDGEASHPLHFSAYVSLTKSDGSALNIPSMMPIFSTLDQHYIQLIFDNQSYEKHRHTQIKCNVTGELPMTLQKDETSVLTYLKKAVLTALDEARINTEGLEITIVKESKKHGHSKDKMKLAMFEKKMEQADRAVIEMNGHAFLLAGDAYRTPDYQIASGLNGAFLHARAAGQVFSGELTFDKYHEVCATQAKKDDEAALLYLRSRRRVEEKEESSPAKVEAKGRSPLIAAGLFGTAKDPSDMGSMEAHGRWGAKDRKAW